MNSFTEKLHANKTYGHRYAIWTPVENLGGPNVGVLAVVEAKTALGKKTVSRYAVLELDFDGGRRFKLTKPGGAEVYFVNLPVDPTENEACDCQGFSQHAHCKHIEGLTPFVRRGLLPRKEAKLLRDFMVDRGV